MRWLTTPLYWLCWGTSFLVCCFFALSYLSVPPAPEAPAETQGTGFHLERGGLQIVHLSGEPYTMGYHSARILAPDARRWEAQWLDALFDYSRQPVRAGLALRGAFISLSRPLARMLPEEQLEVLGLKEGGEDPFPALGDRYARLAGYQALFALSESYGSPERSSVSSSIVVGRERGVNQHASLARNLEMREINPPGRERVLFVRRPAHGFGFVALGFAGQIGVVSGMNEHGLALAVNRSASSHPRGGGVPITLLARRALQGSRTVDEAIALLSTSAPLTTALVSLADGEGDTAVLELTPADHGVRRGSLLATTNHLETPELRSDLQNLDHQRRSSTLPRRQRLQGIVDSLPEQVALTDLLAALRARQSPLGQPLPLGHRHAVDGLSATHSVLFDATAGSLWVGEGPHTLGAYAGYDVRKLIAATSPREIEASALPALPADELLVMAPSIQGARQLWEQAARHLERGELVLAERVLERASYSSLMADHPTPLRLRGRLAEARGEFPWAAEFFRQALTSPPENAREAQALKSALLGIEHRHPRLSRKAAP